jgi:nucleoside-diphosphate-sugar epimerase
MQTIEKSAPVMVTGGTGYIAGWIIKFLLEKGFTVHSTVRDPDNREKVSHLKALDEAAPGTLRLFKADLLNPGEFDDAAKGCQLVMHTASPFFIDTPNDPESALIRPALEGTRNVLGSANRIDTVKRVVLTSSVVATYGDAIDMAGIDGGAFTEAHWNTTSSESHQPYCYSKTIAEKLAWEICREQNRWDLLVINPAMVCGPSLTRSTASGSVSLMKQFGDGTARFGVPALTFGVVDVRDVARAHIGAGFRPDASGRHILCAGEYSLIDIGRMLRAHFGEGYPFPKMVSPKFLVWLIAPFLGITRAVVSKNVGYPIKFDNSYSREDLGIEYRPMAETLIAHFQQLIDDGLVPRR